MVRDSRSRYEVWDCSVGGWIGEMEDSARIVARCKFFEERFEVRG